MTLRPLDPEQDRAAVADLFRRAADYVLLETGLPPDDATTEDFFTGAPPGIDPRSNLALGLFQENLLIGMASIAFGWPAPDDAYIGLMLFDPACRNRGHGPALLAAVAAQCRQRGARQLLLAVLDENPAARRFWQGQGFSLHKSFPPGPIGARVHIRHRLGRAL